jgi:hypothetical protein
MSKAFDSTRCAVIENDIRRLGALHNLTALGSLRFVNAFGYAGVRDSSRLSSCMGSGYTLFFIGRQHFGKGLD